MKKTLILSLVYVVLASCDEKEEIVKKDPTFEISSPTTGFETTSTSIIYKGQVGDILVLNVAANVPDGLLGLYVNKLSKGGDGSTSESTTGTEPIIQIGAKESDITATFAHELTDDYFDNSGGRRNYMKIVLEDQFERKVIKLVEIVRK